MIKNLNKISKYSILLISSLLISNCNNNQVNNVPKASVSPSSLSSETKQDENVEPKQETKQDNLTKEEEKSKIIKVVSDEIVENTTNNKRNNNSLFENQTRVITIKTKTEVKAEIITNKLSYPWGFAFISKDKMIVTEKEGRIKIVSLDGNVSEPLKGVPKVHYERAGGLMDIVLDPEFATNRTIYFAFSEELDLRDTATAIAKAKLSEDEKSIEDLKIIYRAEKFYNPLNYGIRLLFDKNGFLFASIGDRLSDEIRINAQKLDSSLGKIIRINKDGTIPSSNPFVGVNNAKPEIWSIGVRNPQGLAIHPETGELWESEHGAQGGDEINIIQPRLNYGWPIISYGMEYSGLPINNGLKVKTGLEQPIYYWTPSIAPSGMSFYTGNDIPEWKNNLFVAILKGKHISRLSIIGNKIMSEEKLLSYENQRFRHVIQGADNALYAITDEAEGRIYKISKK